MSEWPEERITAVRDLWNQGCSFAVIAMRTGLTKNQVAGFKRRWGAEYGLQERATKKKARTPLKKRSAAPTVVSVRSEAIPEPSSVTYISPPIPQPVSTASTSRIGIQQLTSQTCRWPIGHPKEPGFHFCGRLPKQGSPYCSHHHRVAYNPGVR